MKESEIEVTGFENLDILECQIHKGVNEHGKAVIKFTIEEENLSEAQNAVKEITWGNVKISDEDGGSKIIFTGIITEFKIENMAGDVRLVVTMTGGSCLLDFQKNTRTFQKDDTKIAQILDRILDDAKQVFSGQKFKINAEDSIKQKADEGGLLVQYHETDYEFIKRIASNFNESVITYGDQQTPDGVLMKIGVLPDSDQEGKKIVEYSKVKQLGSYLHQKALGLDSAKEKDYCEFLYTSRDHFEIGSKFSVNGDSYYVYQVDSEYKGELFYNTYVLAPKERFKRAKYYNKELIGASLDATIEESVKDKVKVICNIDRDKKPKDFVEFPYATVYSSKDGTGWYAMPEKDDLVRLHFPSEQEKDAYVINAVHLKTDSGDRDDVDSKSIMNKYLKQIEFHKKFIRISNNKGMFIQLDDDKGISVFSDKNITIESVKDVKIEGKGSVEVSSPNSVKVKQGGASLSMKGKVDIKGTNVNMQ